MNPTDVKKPGILAKLFRKFLIFLKWFFGISICSVIIFKFIPVPVTPFMLYNLPVQLFDKDRKVRLYKDWESIDQISKSMQLAVVCSEDQTFKEHSGFDFIAIKKAFKNNEKGRRVKGGSTISQQTAKNVFLLHHRNYIRKGLEVYFTFLIELIWSKERILEVYLNVIEFGDGIYGVQAASKHFFKKDAKNLSPSEAALLASVLPNPIKYKVNNPSNYIVRRKNWIQKQMRQWGGTIDFE